MKLDPSLYPDNLQTFIKHYVLMHYLEVVAYKTLAKHFNTFVYIDGFSGPWKSKSESYLDTSFGISLKKLGEVRKTLFYKYGRKTRIKCVFVEKNKKSFLELEAACADIEGIEILPIHGRFEGSIDRILQFIGPSRDTFAFTFIDPTGWTVDLNKIAPLLTRRPGEVLFNFMFDHINRFNEKFPESFELLFTGQDWRSKLDETLPPSEAVPKLFADTLKSIAQYDYVASTEVLKATSDRTHFFLFYGTRHLKGLKVFRDIQNAASTEQDTQRAQAKKKKKTDRTGVPELFPLETQYSDPLSIALHDEQINYASTFFNSAINYGQTIEYDKLLAIMLERFVITQKDLNDMLRQAKRDGLITFGGLGGSEKIPKLGHRHSVIKT